MGIYQTEHHGRDVCYRFDFLNLLDEHRYVALKYNTLLIRVFTFVENAKLFSPYYQNKLALVMLK